VLMTSWITFAMYGLQFLRKRIKHFEYAEPKYYYIKKYGGVTHKYWML
jgi:hypothetical protein